jgi:dolichyl-phosphate-mannose--protein O-mannosyl transferase
MSPGTTADTSDTVPMVSKLEEGFQYSLLGNPVKWWIALVIVSFGGMWLATRFKGTAASANIRFNFYNILAVLFLSILGGAIAKVLAAKYQRYLPGISTIVLAS